MVGLRPKGTALPSIMSSSIKALRRLGVQTRLIDLPNNEKDLLELHTRLKRKKPDFLLTVDNTGDPEVHRWLPDLIKELDLLHVTWFVDNPEGYRMRETHDPLRTIIFCWDPFYVDWLRKEGLTPSYYLPLATDTDVFRPAGPAYVPFFYDVSFVGATQHPNPIYKEIACHFPDFSETFERLWSEFKEDQQRDWVSFFSERFSHKLNGRRESLDSGICRLILNALIHRGDQRRREELVLSLADLRVWVFGDEGWRRLEPLIHYGGRVAYGRQVSWIYRRSRINLNGSQSQSRKGLNQRAFDVPASGGFLLTDWKEALPELFEPEREMVCYRSLEELRAMAAHFLRHPDHRTDIIRRAQERIFREHTYLKRMEHLLKLIG